MLKKFNNLFTFVQSVVRSNSDAVAVEEQSAPLVGLQSRLSRHLKTCSAAALLTAGSLMDADAAVVHWNNANLVIPANIDGLYINVETQATGSAGSVVAGWDINPYSATSLTWFNATGTGMCRYPGATTGSAGNLAPGTLVNASRSFGSGAVTVGSSPGNWQLNADNYFGFRFIASDGLTHYAWGRMTVGAAITVRTIAEIAYESVAGVEIAVGGLSVPACTAPTLSGLVTNAGCSGATNGGVNLTATGGSPSPLSYLWSNGATTEDLNNVGPGTYSVTVTAGTCSTTSTFTVGIFCASVAGTVTYSNSGSTPMANAVVILNQSGSEVGRDTTDASGSYSISSLTSGSYNVQVMPNTAWGGVNATDAVTILRSFSGAAPLSGLRLTVADVNGSSSVNSTDALNALNRFTGALTSYNVGDYAADATSYAVTGSGAGTLNVSMLCYGDVNGSYQPTGGFVRTTWRSLDQQGVLRVGATGSYEVPLYASRQVQPGAVSLELALPEGVRLLGVRASEALDAQQVVYHQQGNRVRIAWIDESGAELRTGEALAYLMVEGDARGVWRSSSEVELANVLGEVQAGVELRMPKLTQGFEALAVSIYPNPGQGMRTLEMSLGESMRVVVRVTDALGRVVYAREGLHYGTGTHKLELNMEGWPAGSYQVQVLGETADDKYEQRNLTILQTR